MRPENDSLVIVHDNESGNWEGIYHNGALVEQDHHITPKMLADAVEGCVSVPSIKFAETCLHEDEPWFPDRLDELVVPIE